MPMKFHSNNEPLEFVRDEGVSGAHAQGYFWFWRKFVPALEQAKASSSVSREMIADCYYVAGDVHDFNDAPRTAIACYHNALKIGPLCGAAHREIASMLGRMGQYDQALAHYDKAISLNPGDRHAVSDRADYIGENRVKPPP
ncbi:MAG: tetratricopeptide repeat protein [Pseudomonadota bacterium]